MLRSALNALNSEVQQRGQRKSRPRWAERFRRVEAWKALKLVITSWFAPIGSFSTLIGLGAPFRGPLVRHLTDGQDEISKSFQVDLKSWIFPTSNSPIFIKPIISIKLAIRNGLLIVIFIMKSCPILKLHSKFQNSPGWRLTNLLPKCGRFYINWIISTGSAEHARGEDH